MKSVILITLLLLSSISINAKEVTVMIIGNMMTSGDEEDFGQTALYLTRSAEKKGEEIIIGAPFKMHFINGKNESLKYHHLSKEKHIKSLLRKARKNLEPGDTVKLLVYGHGVPARHESSYNKTSIQLGSERIRTDDLKEIIDENLPKNIGLKIIAPYCFSGSIHQITQNRKNSCSAAASDYRTPSKGEQNCFFGECTAIRSYGMDIGKMLYKNPNMSLAQAHEQVGKKDYINERRGQLSSIDYLQKIFKVGPYKMDHNWFTQIFTGAPDQTKEKNLLSRHCEENKKITDFNQQELNELTTNISDIIDHLNFEDNFHESVPEFIRDQYYTLLEDYQEGVPELIETLNLSHNMAVSSKAFLEEAKQSGEVVDWSERQVASFIADEARQKTNELLKHYYYQDQIKLINKLYIQGSKKQIRNFEDLIRCENN